MHTRRLVVTATAGSRDWNICLLYFGYVQQQLPSHPGNMPEKLLLPTTSKHP